MNKEQARELKGKANYHLHNAGRELLSLRYLVETSDVGDAKSSIISNIDLMLYRVNTLKGEIEYIEHQVEEAQ